MDGTSVERVRLYGLRMLWVEQSYKQVKGVVVATAIAVLLIGVAPQ